MKVEINDLINIYEKEVARNTRNKNKVYRFEKNKKENIYDIKYLIENGCYSVGKYNIFAIKEPKYRIIMSTSIKDKIVNHYVARNILMPKLSKYLDIRNCATRVNMGFDYAVNLVKKYIEKNKKFGKFYILKLDISKYFYSIDHDILKSLIKEELNEEEYKIVSDIIDSTNNSYVNNCIKSIKDKLIFYDENRREEIEKIPLYVEGKGLPIGNMTSQFLSIFYLHKLDHYIVNDLKLKYTVRYMDDYIIMCSDKKKLERTLGLIKRKLEEEYKLYVNEKKTKIFDSNGGFEYLGYVFKVKNHKTLIKLKSENKRRIVRNKRKLKYMYNSGLIDYQRYFNSMSNYNNVTIHSYLIARYYYIPNK